MTLQELYDLLKSEIKNNSLAINHTIANNTYSRFLEIISSDEVTVSLCSVNINAENVIISGQANILPYTSISSSKDGGGLTMVNSIDHSNGHICYTVTLSIAGSGALSQFCGTLPPSYDENIRAECLFSNFIIYNPKLEKSFSEDDFSYCFDISGFASCSDSDERWTSYKLFLADKMPFSGTINTIFTIYPECNLDFAINKQLPFPLGSAIANLAMRVVDGRATMSDSSITKAFLLYDVRLKQSEQTARFQSELFTKSEYQSSAAFFSPPLSLGNIAEFMQSLFGFDGKRLLLPDDTMLSAFGLSELQLTLSKKGNSLFGGLSIERIYSIFSLANPISTAIPNLTLDNFEMVWEASWWGKPDVIVSLFAVARASLKIGSYTLIGEVTGNFPMMEFSGDIALEKELSLTDISTEYGVVIPAEWNGKTKQIASLHISSSALARTLNIFASVSDLIQINIGSLNLNLANLQAEIHIAPNTFDFGIDGTIQFKPSGYEPFSFKMSAQYSSNNWIFSGALQSGKVNIGGLLFSLFSIQVSQSAVNIELDGFDISYSVNDKHFKLFASFSSSWFTVFGITPKLGGKLMLDQTEKALEASAVFYIDIDIFKFLVQANNFYSDEKRSFIFRLEFKNKYIQAVYQKISADEFITITLGGLTFGDILIELIHLINPNASHTLSSPWNILDKIELSNFSLTINVTKKSASLLYHINLNIVGLMEVDDIGLSYSKNDGIKYILTGRLLDKTYTVNSPLSWDAINANPPVNATDNEIKLTLFYLGIGNHLGLNITKETIPDILSEVINQLTPTTGVPTVKYQENSGWLFGIDFKLSDMFRLKVLLYSPKLYGAIITVDASEKSPLAAFNGLLLELYYKKISSSTGMFHCRLVVPTRFAEINLGAISIHLGQFLLEVYTNGSFYLDLGFPHNNDFSNSFGLSFGIFGGKGGIYFGILSGDAVNSVPAVTNGAFTPVIKIGVGLSIGISRSFDFGIVKGGVSLTLVGIFEGTFAIFRPKNETLPEAFYYKARAVVGISGSLFLSVDFKIIAISASAYIQAFCELELESFKESHITLTLDLELSASIKILFFKIEFSFHFNHKASFSFGNNSDTPWQLQNKNANIVLAYPPIQINPDILLGKWSISPIISPMFSVLNPDAVVFDYCMAFPLIINHSDMYSVSELLLKWVLSHISGEFVTYQAAEEIKKADFSAALDYTGLINLLSKNLTVSPKFKFKNANDEIDEGFIFPMLPQLALQVNDLKINYGENYVTESDMELISEYFYRLNADPMYEFSKKSNAIDKSIPLCAAVLTDWFKMALSELTGNIGALFSSITVNTNSLTDVIARYQVESENILLDNPEAIINVSTIPEYEYTVSDGDSLKSIQAKFKLSYNELWNAVSDLSLQKTSIDIFYNDYSFNNNVPKLTVLQASAMFFVRLYNPDTVYTPYAEFILNNNSVSIDWECNFIKELTLSLPYGSYISLAGDTVIRIAKMLCLINNIYAESDWLNFKSSFISENGGSESSVLDSYKIANPQVLTRYTVKGYTNCSSLFRMCYPDLGLDYSNCELWNSEILKPLSVIPLNNIVVSDNGKISDMSMKYGEKNLAAAINQGTAVLANTTALIISMPYQISKTELCEHIISDKNISKIGAILSRGFFQGARPPAPSTKIETPLYELLQQQIKNINTNIDYKFSVENNEKTAAWIIAPPDEVTLTAVQLSSMLPTGNLNKPQLTELINPLHSQPKCWSLSSNKEIINSRFNGKIITLPKDCIEYIAFYNSLPNLQYKDKIIDDFEWCCIIPIEVMRKSDNIYYLYGASADSRNLLYSLSLANISSCELLYSPSKLDTKNSGFTAISCTSCKIIKTKLSKETHYGLVSNSNSTNPYIASLADINTFLKLLWECSVIGGGFWLYHNGTALSDSCFDDDGKAVFQIAAILNKPDIEKKAINSIISSSYNDNLVLTGSMETVFTPALPAGCVGLKSSRYFDEKSSLEGLYQLLGYSIYSENLCCNIESSSILPVSVCSDRLDYNIAVPLWKLSSQQSRLGQYSAVGAAYNVAFNLRDVLGNQSPLNTIKVNGEYNDNLIALNELPCTKLNYLFVLINSKVFIKITLSYCGTPPNSSCSDTLDYANEQSAKINTAKTSMYQLRCPDIVLIEENSICKGTVNISYSIVTQVSSYVEKLYNNLVNSLYESIPSVEILVPISLSTLPTEIVPLCVYLTVKRETASSRSPQICYAKSAVLAYENSNEFYANFNNAFPQQRLAFNQSDEMFFVPINLITDEITITPYSFQNGEKTFQSPEFVSLNPLSNVLITKNVEVTLFGGEKSTHSFINIDANIWEKRFLSDIENLLCYKIVCKASDLCPSDVEMMVNSKKNLSKALSARLIPIRKNSAAFPLNQVAKFAEDRFNANLNLAYNTDTIAVYNSKYGSSSQATSLEPHIDSSYLLSATKLSYENNIFCLFLSGSSANISEKLSLNVSFPNIEYNIKETKSGYNTSEWLRFQKPITEKDTFAKIILTADTKIPFPKKECPAPPSMLNHSFSISNQDFLFWDWTTEVMCSAYEQYTLCFNIDFDNCSLLSMQSRRNSFDILADYYCKRELLMNALEDDKSFASAYNTIAKLAYEYSECEQLPIKKNRNQDSLGIAIPIKVTFEFGDDTIKYTILPDENRDKLLNQIGAKLSPIEHISGKNKGDVISFKLSISHLPLYECHYVTPTAWIIQNDNLFNDSSQEIRQEFIFKTECVSLQKMRISADYIKPIIISGHNIEAIVEEIWEYLKADKNFIYINLSVMYEYSINPNAADLYISSPVTFIPNASKEKAIQNIIDWQSKFKPYSAGNNRFIFDFVLYENNSNYALLHTVFIGNVNKKLT